MRHGEAGELIPPRISPIACKSALTTGDSMGHYDELEHEIDQEMGWGKGKKKPSARRGPDYWQALLRTARASTSPLRRLTGNASRAIGAVIFFPIISPLGYSKHFNIHGDMIVVKRSMLWRLLDGVL